MGQDALVVWKYHLEQGTDITSLLTSCSNTFCQHCNCQYVNEDGNVIRTLRPETVPLKLDSLAAVQKPKMPLFTYHFDALKAGSTGGYLRLIM